MNSIDFVRQIESELIKKGIPKEVFYKESGVSSATMSQWRKGIYFPSSEAIHKIETYLGVRFAITQTNEGLHKNNNEQNQIATETVYERINQLCKAKGISGGAMCKSIGASKSLMTELRKGRAKGISAETAIRIADFFNISLDYLLGRTDELSYCAVQQNGSLMLADQFQESQDSAETGIDTPCELSMETVMTLYMKLKRNDKEAAQTLKTIINFLSFVQSIDSLVGKMKKVVDSGTDEDLGKMLAAWSFFNDIKDDNGNKDGQ